VLIDSNRNYVIAYSNINDKPANATAANGVSWVNYGTQKTMGLLMRWVSVSPYWTFPLSPQENHLDWAHSDWGGSKYDSTLIGVNWRNGFMQCYLPVVHYMTKAEFEQLGNNLNAEKIPVWVNDGYIKAGAAVSRSGSVTVSSTIDGLPANAGSNLIDGNMSSAWSSAFGQQDQTVVIDLRSKKNISAIKLNWDWIFFGKDYTLQISDDNIAYTTIQTVTNGNGAVDLFKNLQNAKARYVKLRCSKYNIAFYRLPEMEVYANDCNCNAAAPPLYTAPVNTYNDLVIYPNPARTTINYKLKNFTAGNNYVITVYDAKGSLVLTKNVNTGNDTIDVARLHPGNYFFTISDGKNKYTRLFIKGN
jgi:hypothetical protein